MDGFTLQSEGIIANLEEENEVLKMDSEITVRSYIL